ncbi:hypothetical protein Purlil1_14278 [Purpureocillium lilacinum]|uniref:Uncharacterized protein n=1 Tax=Purpureocillium lilacinum TaxID=33203 RepID=A0ABR0BBQ3_PURLI|nr:hypothetical protein Purlil1_14278 [Purpureocillium lilacinum]
MFDVSTPGTPESPDKNGYSQTEFPLERPHSDQTVSRKPRSRKPRSRKPRSRKLAVRSHSSAAALPPNGFLSQECARTRVRTPTKRFPANSQECARTLIERVSCRRSALALECGRTPTKRFPANSQECARTLIERASCKLAGARSHPDQRVSRELAARQPEPDSCAPVAGTQVGQESATGETASVSAAVALQEAITPAFLDATMSQVFEPRFLGVVQVPIRDLRFVTGVGERLYKQQQTDRLRKLFKETSINHDSRLNWIDGYIDSTTVESLLSQLRLSQPELSQANAQCIYPCIRDQIVYCTQGRHRIAALDAESCVWTPDN